MQSIMVRVNDQLKTKVKLHLIDVGLPLQGYVAGLICKDLLENGKITQEEADRFSQISDDTTMLQIRFPPELYNEMKMHTALSSMTIQNYLLGLIEADLPRLRSGLPLPSGQNYAVDEKARWSQIAVPAEMFDTLRAYWQTSGQKRNDYMNALVRQDILLHQEEDAREIKRIRNGEAPDTSAEQDSPGMTLQ